MELQIYSIKDTKTGEFQTPFYAPNYQVALRSLKNAVNDKSNTLLTLNTEDFQLYQIGTLNNLTGSILSNVEFKINAVDLKEV